MENNAIIKKYFTTTTARTRAAKAHYSEYQHATATRLEEVYGSYSQAKMYAFEYCERMCKGLGGYGLCIISANTTQFTVGFEFPHPDTGALMFAYITKDYNSVCEI